MNDQTIRIAICASGELYGGVERFVSTYAQHIASSTEVEAVIVLFYDNELAGELRDGNIDVVTIVPRWKYDPSTIWRLAAVFRQKHISIVHTNGYLATILGAVAAKMARVPVVKTEHGKMEPRARRDFKWLRMCANRCASELVTRTLVDRVVYVTKDLQDAYGRDRAGESVINNGILPAQIICGDDEPVMDRDAFNIGMVGRLTPVKGHMDLLNAMLDIQRSEKVNAYFFGTGPIEGRLQDFCNEHNLEKNVHFMGFRQDVLDLVARLDAFVMPSLHEGLPYALLEAMYMGVPIIASEVGGLAEILENDTDALLVEPGNKKELARAIDRLIAEPEKREVLASNARRKVESQFSMAQMAADYLSVYADVNSKKQQRNSI